MSAPLRLRRLQIFPLAIPMRLKFEHAAASRDTADPVVVQLAGEAPYGDVLGYGETLARPYVTGETALTVVEDVQRVFAPLLIDFKAESFAEVVAYCDALPFEREGRSVTAARCAVELALLDLSGRVFGRRASEVTAWLDLGGFCPPGYLANARYSGIVVGSKPGKLKWFLRVQRWYGLRDFKIKVAVPGWEQKLEWAYGVLRRSIERGRATLRADANGGWSLDEAVAAIPILERFGVTALEQPLGKADDALLPELARQTKCHLIADESLVSLDDAKRLLEGGGVQVFNVRVAKHGGLLPALRIAHRVHASRKDVQLGCLVGETSILTAAGMAFLEACPKVRFVEGAFGGWLMRDDVTADRLRFGLGGRIRPNAEPGLGVRVDETRLHGLCTDAIPALTF